MKLSDHEEFSDMRARFAVSRDRIMCPISTMVERCKCSHGIMYMPFEPFPWGVYYRVWNNGTSFRSCYRQYKTRQAAVACYVEIRRKETGC